MKHFLFLFLVPIFLLGCGEKETEPPAEVATSPATPGDRGPAGAGPSQVPQGQQALAPDAADPGGGGAQSTGPADGETKGSGSSNAPFPADAAAGKPDGEGSAKLGAAGERAAEAGRGAEDRAGSGPASETDVTATASTDAGSEYEVVQGDTLVDIAREHGLELAQLRSLNPQVDPRRLQIGQKLRVAAPGNERRGDAGPAEQMRGEKSTTRGSTTAASGPGPGTSAPSAGEYTIRAGDTLFSIAREHQIRLADLRAWNPQANPRRLQVGQTLRLAPR